MLLDQPRSIALATRMGREIANEQDPDVAPHKAKIFIEKHRREFPNAVFRRKPTGLYNCHGLTFANRRTQILDPAIIEMILNDDGYHSIAFSDVVAGDLLVCYDGGEVSHTGIVMHVNRSQDPSILPQVFVLSKWGSAGEYYHLVNTGPFASQEAKYWTDRP